MGQGKETDFITIGETGNGWKLSVVDRISTSLWITLPCSLVRNSVRPPLTSTQKLECFRSPWNFAEGGGISLPRQFHAPRIYSSQAQANSISDQVLGPAGVTISSCDQNHCPLPFKIYPSVNVRRQLAAPVLPSVSDIRTKATIGKGMDS
jgi:hypothetical protein